MIDKAKEKKRSSSTGSPTPAQARALEAMLTHSLVIEHGTHRGKSGRGRVTRWYQATIGSESFRERTVQAMKTKGWIILKYTPVQGLHYYQITNAGRAALGRMKG